MKILTRYLLTGLLFPLLYCLLGLSLVFIVSDLIDNFSDFLESGIRFREILYYYSQLLPSVFVEILPVCLLLAMLYSLSRLTRHSEITAMRAGGVSIGRIVLPFLGAGLAATLLTMLVHEKIAPDATWRAEMFVEYQKAGRNQERYFQDHLALKYHRRVWNIQRFDLRDGSMQNVEMVEQREDGSDAIKYNAEQARWLDGRWWFINLVVQSYRENGDLAGAPEVHLQREMRDLSETPQTFLAEVKDPQFLSAAETRRYLQTKTGLSADDRIRREVDYYSRLAKPFACLIVTLIGVPIGAHTGRRGALAGIMTALGLFFVFYALQLTGQALGKNQLLSPLLSGWLPVLVFGAASPFFILRMR